MVRRRKKAVVINLETYNKSKKRKDKIMTIEIFDAPKGRLKYEIKYPNGKPWPNYDVMLVLAYLIDDLNRTDPKNESIVPVSLSIHALITSLITEEPG